MSEPEELAQPPRLVVPGLALAGSLLLLGGAFCPVIVLATGAARSYYDFQPGDGNILIGLAAVSFVLTWVFRWYRGLFVTGGLALLMIGGTLLKVPRAGLGDATLTWGWLPLATGAVLLLAAALAAERERPRREPEEPVDEEGPGEV
jgi:hypothetical protein